MATSPSLPSGPPSQIGTPQAPRIAAASTVGLRAWSRQRAPALSNSVGRHPGDRGERRYFDEPRFHAIGSALVVYGT
jgi:hypothetical protein